MEALLQKTGVVAVVVIDDAEKAVPVARALCAGGVPAIEVTLRTAAGLDAIARIAEHVPEASIGAGTVLSGEQVNQAIDAGSQFIVSPGCQPQVVEQAQAADCPVYPGVATATEAQAAWNMGLRILKFFPGGLAGGIPMLKALGSVFRDVKFMPTGGVNAANLGEYLAQPSVIACGGSWLTPASAIASGDYQTITDLAAEAVGIAQQTRNQD